MLNEAQEWLITVTLKQDIKLLNYIVLLKYGIHLKYSFLTEYLKNSLSHSNSDGFKMCPPNLSLSFLQKVEPNFPPLDYELDLVTFL